MRTVFLAFGKGAGHIAWACSLFFAFKRAGIDTEYITLSDSEYTHLGEKFFPVYPVELEPALHFRAPRNSRLYTWLKDLDPDLLIVDSVWVPLDPFIRDFTCPKVILFRRFPEEWFTIRVAGMNEKPFNAEDYDLAFSCEPGFERDGLLSIPPLLMRNRNEIFGREEARRKLDVGKDEYLTVIAHNGFSGELEQLKQDSEVPRNAKLIVASNETSSGALSLFPLVDYACAIDLYIGGAGYNTFYETRFFGMNARLYPRKRIADEQLWRVNNNSDWEGDINGADECIGRIMQL